MRGSLLRHCNYAGISLRRSAIWLSYANRAALADKGPSIVPGYTEADARIGWRRAQGIELSVNGINLLDARHFNFDDASGCQARRTRTNLRMAPWMRTLRSICGVVVATIAVLTTTSPVVAAGIRPQRETKATYLYKFASFVTWPVSAFASPTAPLTICIVGEQRLAETLQPTVAGQREGEHPIAIRAMNAPDARCHILYLTGNDSAADAQVVAALKSRPILIVTDLPADVAGHGMIGFVVDGDHVRFDIDNAAATGCGLVISSKLLGLARVVRSRGVP